MYRCSCGHFNDPARECTCSLSMVSRYQERISGPLMDRQPVAKLQATLHIEVPRVEPEKLTDYRLAQRF